MLAGGLVCNKHIQTIVWASSLKDDDHQNYVLTVQWLMKLEFWRTIGFIQVPQVLLWQSKVRLNLCFGRKL